LFDETCAMKMMKKVGGDG